MKLLGWLLLLVSLAHIDAFSAEPPNIVTVSPNFWAVGVNNASQKTITITFDRIMRQGFSAWLGPSSVIPDSQFNSKNSEDGKTFTLDVHLAPAKVYIFALNEGATTGVGFQSPRGIPLAPHFLVFQTVGTPAPEDAPPSLLRSIPENGQDVDLTKINGVLLTFDKPMRVDRHGLHLFENETPVDLAKTRFSYSVDGRTFTLAYNLKPATTYRLELNNVHDIGFATANRIPLWPVKIAFRTAQPR